MMQIRYISLICPLFNWLLYALLNSYNGRLKGGLLHSSKSTTAPNSGCRGTGCWEDDLKALLKRMQVMRVLLEERSTKTLVKIVEKRGV